MIEVIISGAIALAIGGSGGFIYGKKLIEEKIKAKEKELKEKEVEATKVLQTKEQILKQAELEASNVLKQKEKEAELKAKEVLREAEKEALDLKRQYEKLKEQQELIIEKEILKRKQELEESLQKRREEIENLQKKLAERELEIEKKLTKISTQEEEIEKKLDEIKAERDEIERLKKEIAEKEEKLRNAEEQYMLELQRIASMTKEEAKEELMKKVEEQSKLEAAKLAKEIEEQAKREAEKEAKWTLITAIQRLAPETTTSHNISVVDLPSNDLKGRIIGREGRNIRTFEMETGVDLIIDDTPDIVTISSFDPLRREIAKKSLERLIADGRIHPGRIEEMVNKVKDEMDAYIRKLGEETCLELGFTDVHPELYYYIGKLNYRTSYTQNVLQHTKEVAYLAGMMAAELGLDEKMAKRGGLMHDIGKAISHEVGGSHSKVGAELARRYNEPDIVINAILYHHNDEPARYPEAVLVAAADALSAARPGARKEALQSYINRLEKIEAIVNSFENVEKSFAIQAGREVRIIVNSEKLTDEEAYLLTKEIAKRIEKEVEFPGQIKITTIRESRFIEVAK